MAKFEHTAEAVKKLINADNDLTTAMINLLTDLTATAAELNALDGITSSVAELNILTGVTSTAAELNILDTVTATAAELNYLDLGTLGTGAASKAVVLDAGDDYTWPGTGVLTYGVLNDGTDALSATAAEINAVADMSGQVVAQAAGNFAATAATHGNRITLINDADVVITLPAATGTGYRYKFVVVTTAWTGGTIQAASGDDSFLGGINGVDDDADAAFAWKAETADDTITGNGTATGGKVGDYYEFVDVATGLFLVSGFITQSGGSEVTPFSAAV